MTTIVETDTITLCGSCSYLVQTGECDRCPSLPEPVPYDDAPYACDACASAQWVHGVPLCTGHREAARAYRHADRRGGTPLCPHRRYVEAWDGWVVTDEPDADSWFRECDGCMEHADVREHAAVLFADSRPAVRARLAEVRAATPTPTPMITKPFRIVQVLRAWFRDSHPDRPWAFTFGYASAPLGGVPDDYTGGFATPAEAARAAADTAAMWLSEQYEHDDLDDDLDDASVMYEMEGDECRVAGWVSSVSGYPTDSLRRGDMVGRRLELPAFRVDPGREWAVLVDQHGHRPWSA